MRNDVADWIRDPLLLIARALMMVLFVVFGWHKLINYHETIASFTQAGLSFPSLAALIAVVMELGVGIAVILGLFTRPLALLLALYTIAAAFIGHPFWSISGSGQVEAEINFFKNLSIMSGLLVLFLTGAGRFSLDEVLNLDHRPHTIGQPIP